MAPKFKNRLNIGSLLGDEDLQKTIDKIQYVRQELPPSPEMPLSDDIGTQSFQSLIDYLKEQEETSLDGNALAQFMNKLGPETERITRYKVYKEIFSNAQILKRILRVYRTNILQKDVLQNGYFEIKPPSNTDVLKEDDNVSQQAKRFLEQCMTYYNLNQRLDDKILPQYLKTGDYFIEIIDLKRDISFLPKLNVREKNTKNNTSSDFLLLTDSQIISNTEKHFTTYIENESDLSYEKMISGLLDLTFEIEYCDRDSQSGSDDASSNDEYDDISFVMDVQDEDPNDDNSNSKKKKDPTVNALDSDSLEYDRVLLRHHDPDNIIILKTKYDMLLGYIEILEDKTNIVSPSIAKRFSHVIQGMENKFKSGAMDKDMVILKMIQMLTSQVLKVAQIDFPGDLKTKRDHRAYEEEIFKALEPELTYSLKKLYFGSGLSDVGFRKLSKMKVRFIPVDRMEHFCLNPMDYAPYGTSVLDSLVYPSKLYILTQMANVVGKLSRAATVRKWTLETGIRKHQSNIIQQLKRELRNQRISVEDISSFKSVPRILSDKFIVAFRSNSKVKTL